MEEWSVWWWRVRERPRRRRRRVDTLQPSIVSGWEVDVRNESIIAYQVLIQSRYLSIDGSNKEVGLDMGSGYISRQRNCSSERIEPELITIAGGLLLVVLVLISTRWTYITNKVMHSYVWYPLVPYRILLPQFFLNNILNSNTIL